MYLHKRIGVLIKKRFHLKGTPVVIKKSNLNRGCWGPVFCPLTSFGEKDPGGRWTDFSVHPDETKK